MDEKEKEEKRKLGEKLLNKQKKIKNEKPKKLGEKERRKLMKIKLNKKIVKELFAKGLTIWQVTEEIYSRIFDHSDSKGTWIFYQKVNNIRKSEKIPDLHKAYSNKLLMALNVFIQKHNEEQTINFLHKFHNTKDLTNIIEKKPNEIIPTQK